MCGQMEHRIKPDIDVIITPELHAPYAGRTLSDAPAIAATKQGNIAADEEDLRKPNVASGWRSYCLRRDGRRPLKFMGLRVASYTVPTLIGDMVCTQKLTIYSDQSHKFYMSLALHMPAEAPIRSIFDADLVSTHAPKRLLSDWRDKITQVSKAATLSSPDKDMVSHMRGGTGPHRTVC